MKYIIGNWKSNKNNLEVKDWFKKFAVFWEGSKNKFGNLEIVICPPFVYLPLSKKLRDEYQLPIRLGGQDVSSYQNGAFTGAVSALMLSDYVEYVIIGHSERRTIFGEEDKQLFEKVKRAKENSLKIIYCIPDKNVLIPDGVDIIAYEPVWAIGTGKTDTPENASKVVSFLKQRFPLSFVVYGGSVSPQNINKFLSMKYIDGVLPGGASLDPNKFWEIILNASTI